MYFTLKMFVSPTKCASPTINPWRRHCRNCRWPPAGPGSLPGAGGADAADSRRTGVGTVWSGPPAAPSRCTTASLPAAPTLRVAPNRRGRLGLQAAAGTAAGTGGSPAGVRPGPEVEAGAGVGPDAGACAGAATGTSPRLTALREGPPPTSGTSPRRRMAPTPSHRSLHGCEEKRISSNIIHRACGSATLTVVL